MVPFRCLTPRTKLRTPRDTCTKNCYNKYKSKMASCFTCIFFLHWKKKCADLNYRVVYVLKSLKNIPFKQTDFAQMLPDPSTSYKERLLNWKPHPCKMHFQCSLTQALTSTHTYNTFRMRIHSLFHSHIFISSGMCLLVHATSNNEASPHCIPLLAAAVCCFAHQAQQWHIDDITKVTLNWPTPLSQFWETRTMIYLLSTPGQQLYTKDW